MQERQLNKEWQLVLMQERQLEEERAERERLEGRLDKAEAQLAELYKDNAQLSKQLEQAKLSTAMEESVKGSTTSFDEAVRVQEKTN